MRLELKLHPDCVCRAVERIEVEVVRPRPAILSLRYAVTCDRAAVATPFPKGSSQRADELWKHTCFEAFVRTLPGEAYLEFNVATSGDWASYRFDAYRQGMRVADDAGLSSASQRNGPNLIEIAPTFDLTLAAPHDKAWPLALSAVIEETDGNKSYWALAHPPGKPDFHHADSFAYELSP
ncbi:MAG: DOMON-like domain-containing protein [Terricaulis sp.]